MHHKQRMSLAVVKNDAMAIRKRLLAKRQLCTAARLRPSTSLGRPTMIPTPSRPPTFVMSGTYLGPIVVLCVVLCPESPCHGHRPAHMCMCMYPPLENVNETRRESRDTRLTLHMRTHQDPVCAFTLYVLHLVPLRGELLSCSAHSCHLTQ